MRFRSISCYVVHANRDLDASGPYVLAVLVTLVKNVFILYSSLAAVYVCAVHVFVFTMSSVMVVSCTIFSLPPRNPLVRLVLAAVFPDAA